MSTEKRPLIGLTADYETRESGLTEAEYVLRCNYADAVLQAGGLPIILPYSNARAQDYVSVLDGVIITGGMFDIHPSYFGGDVSPDLVTKDNRTEFEWRLLAGALDRSTPVLGICNGMQLMAVQLGGGLVDDIQRDVPNGLEHMPENPPIRVAHEIEIERHSRLCALAGLSSCTVNSLHHQAVTGPANFAVAARSSQDGVVEAIEIPGHRFAMGLQWHPEYLVSPVDRAIFKDFIAAAKGF